jgi:hypothetical protein
MLAIRLFSISFVSCPYSWLSGHVGVLSPCLSQGKRLAVQKRAFKCASMVLKAALSPSRPPRSHVEVRLTPSPGCLMACWFLLYRHKALVGLMCRTRVCPLLWSFAPPKRAVAPPSPSSPTMEQPQNRYTFQIAKRRFVAVEEGLRNNAIAVGAVLLLGTSSCTFSRTCTNAEETRRLTDTSVALPRLSLCLPPRHHKTGGIPRKNKDLHRRSRWLWRVLIVLGPWTSTRHAAQPAFHLTLLFASSCQRRPHRPAVWEDDRSY